MQDLSQYKYFKKFQSPMIVAILDVKKEFYPDLFK